MKPLTGAEIRESYLRWFEARGHHRYPSDSLVPANDPTLLFTGAGMNQFKDMFLGKGNLPWKRITTAQKCLRVPDLENVGRTSGHHTFFEMLGNFSFGDYFKAECLPWVFGWFTEELGLPRDRLVVTIYLDDDEAYEVWRTTVGVADDRIYRFGEKENFWPAQAPSKGPNGPCGPCSEIYFDLEGGPLPARDGLQELPRRFVEIGNCVFTQFDRRSDGSLPPLPQRNIDVGLGLERITAVVQGKASNFETDLFTPYIEFVAERSGRPHGAQRQDDIHMRRIADHARAVTFCISDGALPGNEGRGYVVRKILRRACRDGYELGIEEPFLSEVCGLVCDTMRAAYPQLEDSRKQVTALVLQEERAFRSIYTRGIERFEQWFDSLGDSADFPLCDVEERGELRMPPDSGSVAFELHDTYGFPVDITRALLLDRDFALDEEGFTVAMEQQRDRARKGSALSGDVFADNAVTRLKERKTVPTEFLGYDQLEATSTIVAVVRGETDLRELEGGGLVGEIVTAATPFYAESGGQVGDRGTIEGPHGRGRVVDCKKRDDYWFHSVEMLEGRLAIGDTVTLRVDERARLATERNHTATHLLHAALKNIVGEHVGQAGSLVAPDRLRFDFTHGERLGNEVLRRLEEAVTEQILEAHALEPREMNLEDARSSGFVAMFGEKYGDVVRTLAIGDYSRELCGGTHVRNTGNIGSFRILSEGSVAAGVRRIEAVTGFDALHLAQDERDRIDEVARDLKARPEDVPARVHALRQEVRRLEKELEEAKRAQSKDATEALEADVVTIGEHAFLAASVADADNAALLEALDRLRRKHASFVGVLCGPNAGGVAVVVTVSPDLIAKGVHAGNLVKELTTRLGGGGGGRPEMAQGRGKDATNVDAALGEVRARLDAMLTAS